MLLLALPLELLLKLLLIASAAASVFTTAFVVLA